MEFLSINEVLENGTTHGAIATAIEKNGQIYGWDRFGRFRKHLLSDKNHAQVFEEVFNALAAHYAWSSEPLPQMERLPEHLVFGEFPRLCEFGWPDSEIIDFSEFENAGQITPVHLKNSLKAADNNLRIIGALRECLVGQARNVFNDQCKKFNDANLIDFLESHYTGYSGLGKRNLEGKFAAAKRLLDNS